MEAKEVKEKNDFISTFAVEMGKYRADVAKRLAPYCLPAFRISDTGEQIMPPGYVEENNITKMKFEYFLDAIGYDKKICELVLAEKADDVRLEIQRMNLAELMFMSKQREIIIMGVSFGTNKP